MSAAGYVCRRFEDPVAYRARVTPWLLGREAEHNLLLGLLPVIEASPERFEPPILLASVESGDEVVGCVFRTPPYKLGLTRLPAAAVERVVESVGEVYDSLPAVLGPSEVARRFGELWCARHGGRPREGMRQRIFQLEAVLPQGAHPPGAMRPATRDDLERVVEWVRAFEAESGAELHDTDRIARDRIVAGDFFLWEDEEPVSLAGYSGRTPHGVRIGPVYTPPPLRGRGYATACVAELSHRALASGRRFCFLYTDLANPTSNRIYERIGYRPVADVIDVRL